MKTPSSILALASLTASVRAHGYISMPKATYEPNTPYTNYNALTTASVNAGFAGGKYDGSPSQNTQVFTDHWNATGYKSLREMTDPIAPDYGYSVETATPVDVTGYTEMWWQNDEYKEGFIASHEGPCEAWIGDTQIFHHNNCAAQFKTYPAKIPADYSSCKSDCLLVFYWLALHEPNWQIYKQCVPITNNGSGASATTQSSGGDDNAASSTTQASASIGNGDSDEIQTGASTDKSASDVVQSEASTGSEASSAEQTESTEAPTTTSDTPAPETTTPEPDAATDAPEATPMAPEVTPATPTATEAATTSGKCGLRRHI
ncbi:hypothetical protein PC129_g5506 [Phytophthora cactorum]|uniref:Uncharacterized protein n=1 Tax=Phytophthora cactorum TaxID=29920 RepID=A0A329SYU4_9STRA|nr:hypothetical protein Pcac1_g12133 [Phytophthora cactorum]KAG2809802.1 hypothetical protein PC111_g15903 [Phytophthora cactorum]KAG2846424.1 hypothetical protein PC112_g1480 [Phytophthora cactorum]KAG2864731.1 hypothetical protein PC113_g4304 [Phytophthora cactorum]KAG2908819.1 hypothetical protein PC114_g10302 [Phytophthora cactorum]